MGLPRTSGRLPGGAWAKLSDKPAGDFEDDRHPSMGI
jgi:hypothetical protein